MDELDLCFDDDLSLLVALEDLEYKTVCERYWKEKTNVTIALHSPAGSKFLVEGVAHANVRAVIRDLAADSYWCAKLYSQNIVRALYQYHETSPLCDVCCTILETLVNAPPAMLQPFLTQAASRLKVTTHREEANHLLQIIVGHIKRGCFVGEPWSDMICTGLRNAARLGLNAWGVAVVLSEEAAVDADTWRVVSGVDIKS
jgi:hypothetical protein